MQPISFVSQQTYTKTFNAIQNKTDPVRAVQDHDLGAFLSFIHNFLKDTFEYNYFEDEDNVNVAFTNAVMNSLTPNDDELFFKGDGNKALDSLRKVFVITDTNNVEHQFFLQENTKHGIDLVYLNQITASAPTYEQKILYTHDGVTLEDLKERINKIKNNRIIQREDFQQKLKDSIEEGQLIPSNDQLHVKVGTGGRTYDFKAQGMSYKSLEFTIQENRIDQSYYLLEEPPNAADPYGKRTVSLFRISNDNDGNDILINKKWGTTLKEIANNPLLIQCNVGLRNKAE